MSGSRCHVNYFAEYCPDESLRGFMAEIDELDQGIDKVVLLAAELDTYAKQLGPPRVPCDHR